MRKRDFREAGRRLGRRAFLGGAIGGLAGAALAARGRPARAEPPAEPFFRTRGVVLVPEDIQTWPWPEQAKQAGLSTIATHVTPSQVTRFIQTDRGQAFLETCRRLGLEVEHELHAMNDLLPRDRFARDPAMFRMNEKGDRTPDWNLCVHSAAAVELVCQNAVVIGKVLRPTTGRYFYWIDDGRPMCRCPKCRDLSDSDQALLLENQVLAALRRGDPRASLAHLCYHNTLAPPKQVKPERGVFLEFAPYHRRYDAPLGRREARLNEGTRTHGEQLDLLDANLAVFGAEGAQALEYWLDVSRFAGLDGSDPRPKIPWNEAVFLDDLATYAGRGIRHVTTFAVHLDGQYVQRHGPPPLADYGKPLSAWRRGILGACPRYFCGSSMPISAMRNCMSSQTWRLAGGLRRR